MNDHADSATWCTSPQWTAIALRAPDAGSITVIGAITVVRRWHSNPGDDGVWPVNIVAIRITGESDRDRDKYPRKYFASAMWNTMALEITITSTNGGVDKTTLRALTVRAGYLLGTRHSVEVNIPAFIREHYHPDYSSSEAI